jgi:Zn-dependent protease with chaperone function
MKQKTLTAISPRNWEHPSDKFALTALRKIPGLDDLVKKIIGVTTEKSLRLLNLACSVKTTDTQFHRVHSAIAKACEILDSPRVPEVYVTQSPFFNASVLGADDPFIVIQSGILAGLSDDELLCILGHELGHVLSGHALYKTLLFLLLNVSFRLLPGSVGGMVVMPVVLALKEWDRKSELSADRAALLVTQDEIPNYQLLMKMSGGSFTGEMSINDFFLQAQEYEKDNGALEKFYKLLNVLNASHPFSVIRLKELANWTAAGQYKKILGGDYILRGQEQESMRETWKEAASEYGDIFAEGKSAVSETLGGLRTGAEKIVDGLGKIFADLFKS